MIRVNLLPEEYRKYLPAPEVIAERLTIVQEMLEDDDDS